MNNTEKQKQLELRLKKQNELIEESDAFISDLLEKIEKSDKKISEINRYHDVFFTPNPELYNKSKIDFLNEEFDKITTVITNVNRLKDETLSFNNFIEGTENEKGFKSEIISLRDNFQKSSEKLVIDWEEKYIILKTKIEGLLPGATSTGLSKAFFDQKESYNKPINTFSVIFGLSILTMIVLTVSIDIGIKIDSIEDTLKMILSRLPYFIPLVWLAIFSAKQQSQFKRLREEYIYKETIAKSYESYKNEIDKLDEGDDKEKLTKELLNAMINSCAYNPSITLDNGNHVEKHPIHALFSRIKTNSAKTNI